MQNSLNLNPGKKYKAVKEFIDYDRIVHPVGEIWIYEGTNFLAYDDGLSLYVRVNDQRIMYRLQWRAEEQAEIIENISSYVKQY